MHFSLFFNFQLIALWWHVLMLLTASRRAPFSRWPEHRHTYTQVKLCAHTWYLSRNTSGLLLYWRRSSSRRSVRVSSGSPICWLFTGLPLTAIASTMSFTQTDSAWLTSCVISRNIVSRAKMMTVVGKLPTATELSGQMLYVTKLYKTILTF